MAMPTTTKSIIFDLGAVMVDWNPQAIAEDYSSDTNIQRSIIHQLFNHSRWIDFDSGLISEEELIRQSSAAMDLSKTDLMRLMQSAKESLHAKQDMIALLQLAKHHDLKTYCLSNLSHEWFSYLTGRYDFFKLFDGKVISAQEGMGKPNLDIYQRLINRYKIDPTNTLFIDDRADNTQAAQTFKIKTITFNNTARNLADIKTFILN